MPRQRGGTEDDAKKEVLLDFLNRMVCKFYCNVKS